MASHLLAHVPSWSCRRIDRIDPTLSRGEKGANSGDHSREVETFLLKGQLRRPGVLPKCYFNIAYWSPEGWSGTSEKKITAKKNKGRLFCCVNIRMVEEKAKPLEGVCELMSTKASWCPTASLWATVDKHGGGWGAGGGVCVKMHC